MSIIETKYFINGTEIRPVNADEIGFKMDFTKGWVEAELSVDSVVLALEAKELVIEHAQNQGFHEGLPLTIQVGSLSLEYYIDLTDSPEFSGEGDGTIEVNIKKRRAINWFRQDANGLSFEVINRDNPITTFETPYLIVKDNQLELLISLAISAFTLTKALIEGVKALAEAIADLTAASTPNTGVPPSINTGAIISAALKVAAQAVYVAALVLALIEVTKQIMELIFPPKRYLKSARIKELMIKGCAKLGVNFSSSILNNYQALSILPVPLEKGNNSIFTNLFTLDNGSYNKGYPTANDTTPTLGSLMDFLEDWTQAEFRLINGTLYLEEDSFWGQQPATTVTNTLNIQEKRENRWTYNTGETWKRYYCHYQTDPSDSHTLDQIEATDCEYSTEPINSVSPDLTTIKGLVDISYPFAFAIRKEKLTIIEEAALPFAELADEVVNFFGGNSNLASEVKGRIGVTQISQQYFTTSKIMYAVGGKQPANYRTLIGANAIYNKFHKQNQVKENFKRIYNSTIKFSTSNFESVLGNNYIQDVNGDLLKILTFTWINEAKTADIEYSVESNEAFNVKTVAINV